MPDEVTSAARSLPMRVEQRSKNKNHYFRSQGDLDKRNRREQNSQPRAVLFGLISVAASCASRRAATFKTQFLSIRFVIVFLVRQLKFERNGRDCDDIVAGKWERVGVKDKTRNTGMVQSGEGVSTSDEQSCNLECMLVYAAIVAVQRQSELAADADGR